MPINIKTYYHEATYSLLLNFIIYPSACTNSYL